MEEKTFKPTVDWMATKYSEMNKKLFNGELGGCHFNIFTTGKGATGKVLGWFKVLGKGLYVDERDRRMYKGSYFLKTWIYQHNFVQECIPTIELNGNFTGTENGFLATLVHEMCHYYTYMKGICPKQAHGREFREIGAVVSSRSNGLFTIQRIASAEQMQELSLDDDAFNKRVMVGKDGKPKLYAVFMYMKNGEVRLTTTTKYDIIDNLILRRKYRDVVKVSVSNDINLLRFLYEHGGYIRNIRNYGYWSLKDKDWVKDLDNFKQKTYWNPEYEGQQEGNPVEKKDTLMFTIKTSSGVFETLFKDKNDLIDKLRQRFPNIPYNVIEKIIMNDSNYKIVKESKKHISNIINEVINDYVNDEVFPKENEGIKLTPNMNLGLKSPIEYAEQD